MEDRWIMRPEGERPQWPLTPHQGVGPLRFDMTPDEVSAALREVTPDVQSYVVAHLPDGRQVREIGRFQEFGLTLFYSRDELLEGLVVDGLIGPQVLAEGVALTGQVPSEVERWIIDRAKTRFPEDEDEFGYLGIGVPSSWSLGLVANVQRFGDQLVTRPVLFAEHVLDDPQHILPRQAWAVF
ncbi:hypothetical protein ACFWG0_34445 [Streptomyces yangpuensis]|uniref:hypothetical protein n=1 Tax=Streptomyces yangpuensis TaxID=1648182 RepID=UPI00364A02EF